MTKVFRKSIRVQNGTFVLALTLESVDLRTFHWEKPYAVPGRINHLQAYGAIAPDPTDKFTRRTFLSEIEVRFNGKKILIPEKCKRYIFVDKIEDKIFPSEKKGNFFSVAGAGEDSFIFFLSGGDGIASFSVLWHVDRRGLQGFFPQWEVA